VKTYRPILTKGQAFVEYALIPVMVILIAIMGLKTLGIEIGTLYSSVVCGLSRAEDCGRYFADEFNDLEAWDIVRGKWDVEDGKLCGGPGEGRIFTDLSESDYVINVQDATLFKGNGYGIYFRTTNSEKVDGYNFQYDPGYGKGSFVFRKWFKGRELQPIAIVKAPDFDWYNQEYDIKIVVDGNTFTAFIDDEQVLQAVDDTYSEGGVGFRTWDGTTACFENISVDPPR